MTKTNRVPFELPTSLSGLLEPHRVDWSDLLTRFEHPQGTLEAPRDPVVFGFNAHGSGGTPGLMAAGNKTGFIPVSELIDGADGYKGTLYIINKKALTPGSYYPPEAVEASYRQAVNDGLIAKDRLSLWQEIQEFEREGAVASHIPPQAVDEAAQFWARMTIQDLKYYAMQGLKWLGRGLRVGGAIYSGYRVEEAARKGEDWKDELAKQAGGWMGAEIGAHLGAVIGGPPGLVVGAVAGYVGWDLGSASFVVLRHAHEVMHPKEGSPASYVPQVSKDMGLYTERQLDSMRIGSPRQREAFLIRMYGQDSNEVRSFRRYQDAVDRGEQVQMSSSLRRALGMFENAQEQ